MRATVRLFAEEMERKLAANSHKGGWEDCLFAVLLNSLKQEIREMEQAVDLKIELELRSPNSRNSAIAAVEQRVTQECADVANFAMMIADNHGALSQKEAHDEPTPTDNID